jgi:hypothetical protein
MAGSCVKAALTDVRGRSGQAWGTGGRRFKSGRPDQIPARTALRGRSAPPGSTRRPRSSPPIATLGDDLVDESRLAHLWRGGHDRRALGQDAGHDPTKRRKVQCEEIRCVDARYPCGLRRRHPDRDRGAASGGSIYFRSMRADSRRTAGRQRLGGSPAQRPFTVASSLRWANGETGPFRWRVSAPRETLPCIRSFTSRVAGGCSDSLVQRPF